jgi:uncharacterized membrane-anchored protein
MTNSKEVAQKVFEAFWKNEPHPCNVDGYEIANALREVINQLQQSPGIISCADLLELCEELEKI